MRRGLRVRLTAAKRAVHAAGSGPSSIRTADAPRLALARLGRSGDPVALTDFWQQGNGPDDPDPHRGWTWAGLDLRGRAFLNRDGRP